MKRLHLLGLIVIIAFLIQSAARITYAQSTFTVDTTADSGTGSLREAILDSNASVGVQDIIEFNIAGAGPHTISPTSALPNVDDSVIINGLTQSGSSCTTPMIVINGAAAGASNGLQLNAGFTEVTGLVINGFADTGIVLNGSGNNLRCNFFGTNAAGTAAVPNANGGIEVNSGTNTIGAPGQGNVISGNGTVGIILGGVGATFNTVADNKIGTDVAGTGALGNNGSGVFLVNGAANNTISNNVIANNSTDGVTVGLAFNDSGTAGNAIQQNSIHSNTRLGIDLQNDGTVDPIDGLDFDAGPNTLQNQPTLANALITSSTLDVIGNLTSSSNTNYTIDVYANTVACDGSGSGEGQTHLGSFGVLTDPGGTFSIAETLEVVVLATQTITVTATDPSGNTSEFSNCIAVTVTTPGFNSTNVPPGGTLNMTTPYGNPTSGFITVEETGNGTLNVGPISLTGGGGQIDATTTNFLIPDGQPPIDYFIACDATAVGTFTATLTMPHNAGGTATYTINCTVTAAGYGSNPAVGSTINVGSVAVGGTVATNLEISETGDDTLTVSPFFTMGGTNPGDFNVTGFPISIPDGQPPQNLSISCTPLAPGARSATLTLTTNDPTQSAVLYNLTCTGATPGYDSNPAPGTPINVGSAIVGSPVSTILQVSENGGANLTISAPVGGTITGTNAADFSISPALPITINEGSPAVDITITCTPSATGPLSATLSFDTNDPTQSNVSYALSCTGLPPGTPGYGSNPTPGTPIDVGAAVVGSPVTTILQVIETGTANLTVSAPAGGTITGTNAADFGISATLPFTINDSGAAVDITITCTPSGAGTRSATLSFDTNDPTQPNVSYALSCTGNVAGYGSIPAASSTINVGAATVGSPVSTNLQVLETGAATLNVTAPAGGTITGTNAADFGISPALPISITDGGAAVNVTITCTPSGAGARSATLSFDTNDPTQPNVTYALTCTGNVAGYNSNPAPGATIPVGSAAIASTISVPLQVSETGAASLTVSAPAGGTITGANATDFGISVTLPFTINDGGAAVTINVSCTPSGAGPLTATLSFDTNDPTQPNVTYALTCTGLPPSTPGFGSNPAPGSTINVGSAFVGNSVSTNLQISETGSATLTVSAPAGGVITGANAADFTITPLLPITINDGAPAVDITITCTPSAIGALTATLSLDTDDPTQPNVTYTLTCTGDVVIYNSNPAPGAGINVGSAVVGSPVSSTLQVSEGGTAALTVSAPAGGVITGANAADFAIGTTLPFTINNGGAAVDITITCTPSAPGVRSATLSFDTNDPTQANVTYALTCTGNVAGYGSTPAPAAIIPVGNAAVGSSVSTVLQVTETGTADLTVSAPAGGFLTGANAADFGISVVLPFTIIEGGAAVDITITCTPSTTGALTATLSFDTNDPTQSNVAYTLTCTGDPAVTTPGYGSNPAAGTPINVGTTAVGVPVDTILQVTETGTADLTVSAPAGGIITGANAADFAINVVLPFTITDGGLPIDITITCTPSTTGALSATLSFDTNDPTQPNVSYALSCAGAVPGYSSFPAPGNPINVGSALVGSPVTANLQVTETGTADLVVSNPVISGTNAADFTIMTAMPLTVTDGSPTQNITIRCIPGGNGLRGATLQLTTNDPTQLTVNYTLTCVGSTQAGYSSIPAPGSTINVGTALLNTAVSTNITVIETGNATLTVSNPLITGTNATEFSLTTALPLSIADGAPQANINVQCIPTGAGLRTATLTLTTNDPTQVAVSYTLNCTGNAATLAGYSSSPTPNSTINMTAPVGSGVTVSIVVSETGSGALNVTTPAAGTITGINAPDFAIIFGAPPFTIADGGASQTVTIRCIPSAIGQRLATLSFNTNDPTQATVSYNLSCVGTSVTDANATATPLGGVLPTSTITIPMSPTPTPLGPAAGQVIGVRGLAVRTGPYLGATIIGVIRPGATYSILAQSQDEGIYTWYLINIGRNRTGWVSGRYFQTSGNVAVVGTQSTIFDQIDGAPDTGVTATANAIIDMRRRPSGRTVILTQIPRGATVSVIGRTMQGGVFWLHVRYNGFVGWIPAAPVDINGSVNSLPIR